MHDRPADDSCRFSSPHVSKIRDIFEVWELPPNAPEILAAMQDYGLPSLFNSICRISSVGAAFREDIFDMDDFIIPILLRFSIARRIFRSDSP